MKRGRQDFCEDVGVVVARGDVADTHEGVADHFAEPFEAQRHKSRVFGYFFGVGAIDSGFVVDVQGRGKFSFESEFG